MRAYRPLFEDGEQFYLPDLPRLIPIKVQPRVDELEVAGARWAAEHLPFASVAERDAFVGQRPWLWSCFMNPLAGFDRALIACNWNSLLFAFDDAIESLRRQGGRDSMAVVADDVVRGLAAGGDDLGDSGIGRRFQPAFRAIWRETAGGMSPDQRRRFLAGLDYYFRGVQAEMDLAEREEVPDPAAVLAVRTKSIGLRCMWVLFEYSRGTELAPEVVEHPDLERIRSLAETHIFLVNDLFGLRREHYQQDDMNIMYSLRWHAGRSLQQAVDIVCGMVTRAESEMVDLGERLIGSIGGRRDVGTYLETIGYTVSGNLKFCAMAPRYHGRPNDLISDCLVTLHPDRTEFARA